MAQLLNNLFGGSKTTAKAIPTGDADFADFADAPAPAPPVSPVDVNAAPGIARGPAPTGVPYTKWYNVHERHSLSEFRGEGLIIACMAVILVLHLLGARLNRSKARKWARAHAGTLIDQFALVGFAPVTPNAADKSGEELVATLAADNADREDEILREKSLFEFATYATGRQNVAFVDVKLTLKKRFNPIVTAIESTVGFFWDTFATPDDTCEAFLYPFDGKEALTVPGLPGAAELKGQQSKSAYDGFVWAIVNKEHMKQFRDERYDLSITVTKDNPKLPAWLTVMTESAEITDILLTPELIKAAEQAGEQLDYLIISDQPTDRPTTLDETNPRKRIFLKYRLPSDNNYAPLVPIFSYFLTLPDILVRQAHFRPNVVRTLREVRDRLINRIKKEAEDEKAEERAVEREKAKKAERDAKLAALDAKQQKKYLEKEREKELRKQQKRSTTRA
ncbi:hypothetical protein GE09DRAFT_1217883 [Coniochaeta sp. 2T2.1]|nr:hypothetical protein GE09DRAFT_1217883 [Coniochaeta sp. 2T2.1]